MDSISPNSSQESGPPAQVPDLSVVAAQAAAQVERAREAARRQMAAALSAKPKLLLHVSLDAPKVAVPIPAVGDEGELL